VLILPIPIPNKNEDHNDFMDRCLSDKLMNSEYPDNKQRYAICQTSWDKSKKRSDSSMEEKMEANLKDAGREEVPELKRSKPQRYETRTLTLRSEDIKADEKIVAKIASFDSRSQNLGGFYEKISPGAFKKTIQESDIRALLNHDSNYVLGRVKSGTITLEEREDGLYMNCTPPDTQWARDLMVSIGRGDIDQCSFGFRVIKDSYNEENGDIVRSLHEVELFDVSVVTYPAYLNTSAFVRSFNRSDLMKDLVNSVETGKITEEELEEHLRTLLNEPGEDSHSNNKTDEPSKTLIDKRKRELELLENQIKN
jgi:HK97 family phage prohead protease